MSTYTNTPIEDLLSKKADLLPSALPLTLNHPNGVNPILKARIKKYSSTHPDKIEQCFIDHQLKANNFLNVYQMLALELNDIMKAMCNGDIKEAKTQLEDLAVKADCMAILSGYIISLYPIA